MKSIKVEVQEVKTGVMAKDMAIHKAVIKCDSDKCKILFYLSNLGTFHSQSLILRSLGCCLISTK